MGKTKYIYAVTVEDDGGNQDTIFFCAKHYAKTYFDDLCLKRNTVEQRLERYFALEETGEYFYDGALEIRESRDASQK